MARVCYRLLGWRQDIEDVVQDVFLVALRGLPDFRGDSRIETWLTRVAVNTCRSHLRRRALWLRVRAVLRCERQESAASPAEHDLARHERVGQVQRALRRLPARDREVLVLRYLEGLPVAELAAVLEVSHNAVEVRLSRARKRLKSELLGALDR
ncbi:MAG: sigma-70 family RNA polymerase sigma factor [Planctomycetes bacterium]|nr:sigma-70 family RNA polymerase sigma factor [Planctomycetota bacterium]